MEQRTNALVSANSSSKETPDSEGVGAAILSHDTTVVSSVRRNELRWHASAPGTAVAFTASTAAVMRMLKESLMARFAYRSCSSKYDCCVTFSPRFFSAWQPEAKIRASEDKMADQVQQEDYVKAHKDAPFFKKHPKGFGEMTRLDEITIAETYLLPVPHLADWLPEHYAHAQNERQIDTQVTNEHIKLTIRSQLSRC